MQYFETYMSSQGMPQGDGYHPVHKKYDGFDLLTDNPNIFMSSFIPQFCYYLSKGFQMNSYYKDTMLPAWFEADKLWWYRAIPEDAVIWGVPVSGRLFGAGAGPAPSGYSVERIEGSKDLVVSAAIMAGFLPIASGEGKLKLNTIRLGV